MAIAVVHMGDVEVGRALAAHFELCDVPFISDADCKLYRAFGLQRGGLRQILGPKVILRGFQSAVLKRRGFGKPAGDVFQMPGVFLVHRSQILNRFIHRTSADKPDYLALAKTPIPV